MKLLFFCERVNRNIAAHRRIFDPLPPSTARVYLHRAVTQKMVSFCLESIFYRDFHSPFFQLKCCHVPQLATWDITIHRQVIALPLTPLHLVTLYEVALQKEQ